MVSPLPWLVAKSCPRILLITTTTIIIIIITTTARVGCPFRTVQAPWLVGHLQLEIPSQPYQLLMLLDGGLQFEERRVSDQKKGETSRRKKKKRERRTHRPGVWRKRVAYNIGIMGHDTLPSKTIRAVSIDRPREMWRINWLISNKPLLLEFSTIRSHDKQGKRKGKEEEEIEHIPEQ